MAEALILASSSPRRRELLTWAGVPFEIDAPDVEEACALPACEAVGEISLRKARAGARAYPGRFILAADTLVVLEGEALGKPTGPEDAKRMLRLLSGRSHKVCTGVTVIAPDGRTDTRTDISLVTFETLSAGEIDDYVATGEPLDKAGAYAIQGRAAPFVSRLEGCWSGVIGLPLYLVRRMLKAAGFPGMK